MKNSALLMWMLLLLFPTVSFGASSPHVDKFSNYINSPEGTSESPIDKKINLSHATNDETGQNSEETNIKPVLQGIPAQWQACAVDSDCTAGVVDCVSWEAINKKYLKKLSENLRSCSASIDPGFQPEAVCVKKFCESTKKITHVSWAEWLSQIK